MHLGGMMNIQKGMFDNAAIEKYKVGSKVMESKKKCECMLKTCSSKYAKRLEMCTEL